jgi:hypothetical protein
MGLFLTGRAGIGQQHAAGHHVADINQLDRTS